MVIDWEEMRIKSAQNKNRFLSLTLSLFFRMFVTGGKKGEMEIVQKAQGEKNLLFLADGSFSLFKYDMNRIYMWVEKKISGERKERHNLKQKRSFETQDLLCTVVWHLGAKSIS